MMITQRILKHRNDQVASQAKAKSDVFGLFSRETVKPGVFQKPLASNANRAVCHTSVVYGDEMVCPKLAAKI
jgi:hypothetical protein